MIVPMKRLLLICLESDRDRALERLSALGAVQIDADRTESPAIAAAAAGGEAAETAAAALREAASNDDPYSLSLRRAKAAASDAPGVRHVLGVVGRYLDAFDEAKSAEATLARFAPWGDFDPADARRLAEAGVPVSLFDVSARDFSESAFPAAGTLRVLYQDKDRVCGAFVGAPLPEGVASAPLPSEPLSATRRRLEEARAAQRMAAGTLRTLGREKDAVLASAADYAERRAWALAAENLRAAGPVAHLAGWIPGPDVAALREAARAEGWGLALRDPEPEETPPVQLRPPAWTRPFLTVLGGLGILPGYAETDISVPFYCFFTLFFAMLVGDAGYGALLLGLWFALRARARKGGREPAPAMKPVLTLLLVFSVATIVWGVLSGTYFGVPHEWLPGFMATDLPTARWLGDQGNIMWLCFTIGLVHLELARVWNILQLWPDSKALAELGWGGVIFSMYNIVCSIAVPGFVYPGFVTWVMVLSVALILLFTYKKSELKANVVSLCMTPLNVISSMGDIISYVRLFAVGLAAVKIAETFDTMAASLGLPLWLKIPCMVVILLLGHALNLAMGALSILVHAVRLNTLEFSTAKGISWSGLPYTPFNARKREDA